MAPKEMDISAIGMGPSTKTGQTLSQQRTMENRCLRTYSTLYIGIYFEQADKTTRTVELPDLPDGSFSASVTCNDILYVVYWTPFYPRILTVAPLASGPQSSWNQKA
jgi:hypothetical protein